MKEFNVEILYEDENLAVLNKPPGLTVHPDGRTSEKTLADWVAENFKNARDVGEPLVLSNKVIKRSGIVHRLDRETSGAMLVAKNQAAFLFLKEQFKKRQVRKIYRVFVWGEISEPFGFIDRPIGRSRGDFRKWSAGPGSRGERREAVTQYKVLARAGGASYLEAEPKTGRTHQLRVHFKAIGHPVVCDKLYAFKQPCLLGFGRLALHAHTLIFKDLAGREREVAATLPADFAAAEESIGFIAKA
ncbi:MAG: RluA family pseudouridine synthase [Candidatus Taylorbacteria bacterium]|nr:RluA family pseudouridine synthase [Candidatus Taylorbacteria bacterium]